MTVTDLKRFNKSGKAWAEVFTDIYKTHNDEELNTFVRRGILNSKDSLTEVEQEKFHIWTCTCVKDIMNLNDEDFGNVCLDLADASIKNASVIKNEDGYVYHSEVYNTFIYYPILIADYLVNTKIFKDNIENDASFTITIKVMNSMTNDPFVLFMNTGFKDYFDKINLIIDQQVDK